MKSESTPELDQLVSAMLDGQLSAQQSDRLQELLAESPAALSRYLELLDNHEALCAIYPGEVFSDALGDESDSGFQIAATATTNKLPARWSGWGIGLLAAIAATLLLAIGSGGYFLGSGRQADRDSTAERSTGIVEPQQEQSIAGHAMLRRSVDIQWGKGSEVYRDGDVFPGGTVRFDEGIAEVDFFCGATLTIEGPAELVIESDWEVTVLTGRLRANVPPAARGFVVKAADSEIIDLGTEFSVDVSGDNARVEVIDGEVKLRGGKYDGQHLLTGERQWLGDADSSQTFDTPRKPLDIQSRREDVEAERFSQWRQSTRQLAADPRLIAYFPIGEMQSERLVPNAAATGHMHDGILIGPVQHTTGRFGSRSHGLEFDRVAARVRTRIEGEFSAFTFSTWVRINSLDHAYNALFMGDGYENGEPHWQIRDDGRLMFSVMVDDTQRIEHQSALENRMVVDAGLHRVYMTDRVWDISKSGRWFHLAAVYDPASRLVTQFVDGEQVSSEPIRDKFFTDQLRIGPAEIGNWGQPFRKSPAFAVRNLNGTIDEMAIFREALGAEEIKRLYEQGKPLGY